jgi:hypothetical protein
MTNRNSIRGLKFFSCGNAKMIHTAEANNTVMVTFGLPAGETCPFAGKCKQHCYASCGNYGFPTVKNHLQHNLEAANGDLPSLLQPEINRLRILAQNTGKQLIIRLHDTGDFFNMDYIQKWNRIIQANPDIIFYCYTKSWQLLDSAEMNWQNVFYIPSTGGISDDKLGRRAHATVIPEHADAPDGYALGIEDDLANLKAFVSGKSLALRAHGAKRRAVA